MSRRYPVVVDASEGSETPRKLGIFSHTGYWHSLSGDRFEFGLDQAELADLVARAINLAYEDGQQNARNQMREALGLEWVE